VAAKERGAATKRKEQQLAVTKKRAGSSQEGSSGKQGGGERKGCGTLAANGEVSYLAPAQGSRAKHQERCLQGGRTQKQEKRSLQGGRTQTAREDPPRRLHQKKNQTEVAAANSDQEMRVWDD
jgi:hypothetical protein